MNPVPGEMLLGDIGGTNARFALLRDDRLGPIEVFAVNDYPRFTDALAALLASDRGHKITSAAFAAAGVVDDDRCPITNSGWLIDAAELRESLHFSQVLLVNDFEALAWSLPQLGSADLFAIGNGRAVPGAPLAVLGPGTGLGLACFVPHPGGDVVVASEGGHASFAAGSAREDAIIAQIRQRCGHVSAERVLSGGGLVNLYEAIAAIEGKPAPERGAADITTAGLDGSCALCRQALDTFCAMLGSFAGDAALTFGARGGVYIGGGIAPRLVKYLQTSQFRARFEAKGRLRPYLAAVPSFVIVHPDAALVGLQRLAGDSFSR